MIDKIIIEEVEDFVRLTLTERFKDEFKFGPIVAVPKTDQYGDEYVQVYIVFEGEQTKLDPEWTGGLGLRIRPLLQKRGITNAPRKSSVEKSEWLEVYWDKYHQNWGFAGDYSHPWGRGSWRAAGPTATSRAVPRS